MILKPFFSYFGSKYRIAKEYPQPSGKKIIEPFAGSAGYSTRYYGREVLLNEINPVLFGVWDYLIHVKESEVRSLPLIKERIDEVGDTIPQEAKWLIGFWLSNGTVQPQKKMSKWADQEEYGTSAFLWSAKCRDRIADQLKFIRHWKVQQGSYADLVNEKATWFIDPPYQGEAGKHYKFNHSQIDYEHLGKWCQSRQGMVIVCESSEADWLPFRPFVRNTKWGHRAKKSHEVFYYQRD